MNALRLTVLSLSVLLVSCGETAAPKEGDACPSDNDCGSGLTCTADAAGDSICMKTCAEGSVLCADGKVCLDLQDASGGVCWPGGATALDEACTGARQCGKGLTCVNSGGSTRCVTVCKLDDEDGCATGEVCAETTGGGGFCREE